MTRTTTSPTNAPAAILRPRFLTWLSASAKPAIPTAKETAVVSSIPRRGGRFGSRCAPTLLPSLCRSARVDVREHVRRSLVGHARYPATHLFPAQPLVYDAVG